MPQLSEVRWFGIDFGYTMMNPLAMHHSVSIPAMYSSLGREGEGKDALLRWYKLRDSLGSPNDLPHQKVRLLKEYNRDRLYAEVFRGDQEAIRLYGEVEARERKPPSDLKESLEYMKSKGRSLTVVSEVMGGQGTMTISESLRLNGTLPLFDEVITPSGRFTLRGKLIDESGFVGTTKKDGSIYASLARYLDGGSFPKGTRAIIGDDPKQDIEQAKRHGFVAIQYSGIVDRGNTGGADFLISRWADIKALL